MPAEEVMPKFEAGKLHSGSKTGPVVRNKKQALAIMLSERRAAEEGKKEYQPSGMVEAARRRRANGNHAA